MKIREIRSMQGANFWSKKPVIRLVLDLENYAGVQTNQIPGFWERLVALIPSLQEHKCELGTEGALIEIIKQGSSLDHVLEHIAIELQYLAYMDTYFCKAFPTKEPGVVQIVYEYWVAEAGVFVGEESVRIVEGIVRGASDEELDIDGVIDEIKRIRDDHYLGPSTMAIVDEARHRNITVIRLDDYNLVQLGEGRYQKRIQASLTSGTGLIAAETASNKKLTKMMLEDNGIPVPPGTTAGRLEHVKEDAAHLGYPVVVKPLDGHHGKGITVGIKNEEELAAAFARATEHSAKVIVEKMVVGNDYRILVVDGKFIAAAHRIPARVVGDGEHTIEELIRLENKDPKRGRGHENFMTMLGVSAITERILAEKDYTLQTVPAKDERFYLEKTANLSTGGMAVDVSHKVHSANRFLFERAARIIGLDIAGLDVLAPTLETPITKNGGVIIEVNAAPGLRMHLKPSEGKPRNVGEPIVNMLFPPGAKHDVPIVSITGTNGKTTTARLVNHILKGVGYTVGMTTTDGIYIRDRCILEGDMSGPRSARIILQDPTIDCAVFETARGGLLRHGLGYGTADVGVCLNVAEDHIGMGYIETIEDLARLKSIVPETVRKGGYSVLNVEDKWCREMAARCTENLIWISLNPQNPVVLNHIENGKIAVVYQNGYITILDGDMVLPVARAYEVPITMEGKAYFNILNALAATAVGYALKVKAEEIKVGLASFFPSPTQTPGRMNIITLKGFDVMIDYAHNPRAYLNICDLIGKLNYQRRILVLDAVGDRRDEDIRELSRISAGCADFVILYEDKDLRGRKPGEVIEQLRLGFEAAGYPAEKRVEILDEWEAIGASLKMARPGDLIIYMTGRVNKAIQYIYDYKEKIDPLAAPPALDGN